MKKTQAQLRAEAFKRLAIQYGFEVEIVIQEITAEMFDHDPSRVMLPSRTIAHVHFQDRELDLFGDFGSVGWVSWNASERSRASTHYIRGSGHVNVWRSKRMRTRKLRTPRQLYAYINGFSYRLPIDEATRISEEFAEAAAEMSRCD